MESLAFALFGLVCLAVYAGAKSLDDRDRILSERAATPQQGSRAQDQTISFASGERISRVSDRPAERESSPGDKPRPRT